MGGARRLGRDLRRQRRALGQGRCHRPRQFHGGWLCPRIFHRAMRGLPAIHRPLGTTARAIHALLWRLRIHGPFGLAGFFLPYGPDSGGAAARPASPPGYRRTCLTGHYRLMGCLKLVSRALRRRAFGGLHCGTYGNEIDAPADAGERRRIGRLARLAAGYRLESGELT